ncbi:unnamed protein product [Microthlaspi erraticum]|uniref:Pentacotripeptide-repeat region of PRORP domain-containing protein n=1 Tax=Microthlaspi erraticum TaxID=1685480 RepID=A0A6D2KNS1_9BRAS|nr:unnamed protein product [Microthlaspi erraticum]
MWRIRLFSAPINHHRRLINIYRRQVSSVPSSPPMSKYESDPNSIHSRVVSLIKLCNLDAAAEHARLAVLATSEPKVTAETCAAIIDAMCSVRRYSDAHDLFDYFSANSNSDLVPYFCCNAIIKAFCEQGKLDEAFGLYKRLLRGNGPRYSAQLALAQGLVDAGRTDEAIKHFYCVDRSLYGVFIRGFLGEGNLERANQLFQELKLCGDSDAVMEVSSMFMEHWFKQGMDEKAMECYVSSKEEFSEIRVNAGNALLSVLLRYGRKTEAWLLFSQMMLEQSSFPELCKGDSGSCNIMVNECFKLGKITEAVEIFRKAVGTLTNPQLCYRNMITRFCEQGMLSEAERCFAEMCSKNYLVPDLPAYRTMRDAYVKEVRVRDALKTLNQTVDASLTYIAKKAF